LGVFGVQFGGQLLAGDFASHALLLQCERALLQISEKRSFEMAIARR
jgi:hypothetical protein